MGPLEEGQDWGGGENDPFLIMSLFGIYCPLPMLPRDTFCRFE